MNLSALVGKDRIKPLGTTDFIVLADKQQGNGCRDNDDNRARYQA